MDTKILSSLEEIAVLDALIDNYDRMELSTNGSSRLVYALPTKQMRELCTLIEIPYKEYVIKVVLGEGGKNQMDNEVSVWNAYSGFLKMAPIAAYGKYVEIMERVTPFDDDDDGFDEGFDVIDERAWSAAADDDVWGFAYWSFFRSWYLELIKADNDLTGTLEMETDMAGNEYHDRVFKARDYAFDMGRLNEAGFEKVIDMSKQLIDAFNSFQTELGDTTDNCQFGRNMNTGEIQNYDYGFRGGDWGATHVWDSSIGGDWKSNIEYEMYLYDLKMSLLHPARIPLKSIEELWNVSSRQ